jgi:DNA-binding transcriptional regulator YdaS (Cro superfamily)
MKFKNWVKAQGGATKLAARLGIETPTVNHWLWGNCSPRPKMMQRLVKLGKGAFSYDDLINETQKKGATQ